MKYPSFETEIPYSEDSSLNTLSLCLPRPLDDITTSQVWLIYIHGGAWRDPAITASSFHRTQDLLLASPQSPKIAAIASVNYRLSPYPSHCTDPSSPHDPARNARHPDHINDVLSAILYLQETYGFGNRYILIGHSCGATLAFQVAIRRYWGAQYESTLALELNVEPPLAIMGVEGIYDLPALVEEYARESVYRDFITNAFGPNEDTWAEASMTKADFEESWSDGMRAVLVHSKADELVSMKQPKLMLESLKAQGWKEGEEGGRRCEMVELEGLEHDEVWRDGRLLADVIGKTVDSLLG
jgi:kynurenine formamidase